MKNLVVTDRDISTDFFQNSVIVNLNNIHYSTCTGGLSCLKCEGSCYFKDDMILLPMGSMGLSSEPQDMDLLFVENDEGTMDLYIYLSGVWMENDPEMMEWYYTKETFDTLAPVISGISADIFTLDSETQSFVAVEKATKTLGQYFVPRLTDALSLMAMDDLCYSCADVTLTLMEGMATVFIDSSYSNGGLSVTGSTGFIIEKDGTFPYEITLPE